MKLVWGFTALVMAAGLAQGLATVTELRECGGILRYAASADTPVWAEAIGDFLSFGTILPVIFCGILVWFRDKTPSLFLAGGLMFLFSALGPATGNLDLLFLISMFGEGCMVFFLHRYCRWRVQKIAAHR